MTEIFMMLAVISAIIVAAAVALFLVYIISYDELNDYEPITDDELLLLSLVDDRYHVDLLEYARTLRMSIELQDYLKDKKDALSAISYYMLAQAMKKEQEKKEKWKNESQSPKDKEALTHNERMILQRLKSRM